MEYLNKLVISNLRSGIQKMVLELSPFQYQILFGICTFFVAYLIGNLIKKLRSNFPPGPIGLPIVGYLPFLSENTHLDLIELGKKYGDIFSIRLGSENIVILHGADIIREALAKPELLGRHPDNPMKAINPFSAFFVRDVHVWKEQRRFVVQTMRDLGLGRTKIEEDVLDEINHFLEVLKNKNGQPIDVKEPLSPSMSNNICALIFGKRYEYDDPDRQLLDKNLDEGNEFLTQTSASLLFPWIRFIPFLNKFLHIKKSQEAFDKIRNFFVQEIQKHVKSLDPRNIRDFIDGYLVEMKTQQEKNPNTTFNDDMLVSNVLDIFSAGSETVRTTILWFVYSMAAFPDVQKKIQQEILEIIGTERNPEFLDLKSMPYTHAVLLEQMRWKTIVPLNLIHYSLDDTKVGGYDIPKNTTVIANFWQAHNDTRYWDEPEKFKPERFLSEDGRSVVKSKYFMGFSSGKRVCPGESMAYLEMFLYFTSMLQKFDIVFPPGTKPTFDAKLTITYRLEPFKVQFIPKH
ncbi:cytochrome P450 2J2 [Trichonephila inaurata madagascariensis]|uniref:Cytochrome P450 2J2 n=1 Tax=Trichonephila inaurata madagascariensis TaxID=2747483 RepID=A0A8X7BPA5_9ARAC|nr:cytochrome P450 2J2 [Trichonephila inaurata madagascariensis]